MSNMNFNVTDRMVMTVKAYEKMKADRRKKVGYTENDSEIKKWTSNCFKILGEELNKQNNVAELGDKPDFAQFNWIKRIVNGMDKQVMLRRNNTDNSFIPMKHTMLVNHHANYKSDLPIQGDIEPCWDLTNATKELKEPMTKNFIPEDFDMKNDIETDKAYKTAQQMNEWQQHRQQTIQDLQPGINKDLNNKLRTAEAKGLKSLFVDGTMYKHKLVDVGDQIYSYWRTKDDTD